MVDDVAVLDDPDVPHANDLQVAEPLFTANGGHGMIFKTFDGRLMLVLHQPNSNNKERAQFFELQDTGDRLVLKP